ncbi:uncharacterized protein BX663DRAFT_491610 [Cokeromyces recurvatus]|uniref:uncharacterized protein n=1 Tax=Cokeromyces recurvatus TaxID=90255 RepID=UPI0022208E03|nr:uncharacterized protein BX663DRAFT_491610 [Cokeromyces recurvatus]KAI7907661.1 hypothetical protein BX663DRAFT_491610 [Cokeromyces recurvatus]
MIMMRTTKFIWATSVVALTLIMLLVVYTSTQTFSIQLRFNITPLVSSTNQVKEINRNDIMEEEKFITFLPHSGLHNQRIELINSIVLAKALNRTLILPHINIGKAIPWRPTPLSELRLSECTNSSKRLINSICRDFNKYTPVSVEAIFDLSAAYSAGVRIIQRDSMSQSYFRDTWSIPNEDIYRVKDVTRYSYRIYDSKNNQNDLRNFDHRIDLEDLHHRNEKLILFGSLHYTMRLALEEGSYLKWLTENLRKEISISHPIVIRQALRIVSILGGPDAFVGVHLRQGDGYFKALMDDTLNTLRSTLEQINLTPDQILQNPVTVTTPTPQTLTAEDEEKLAILKSLHEVKSANKMNLLSQCVAWHKADNHPRLRLIYMATDTPQPRTKLKALYNEFPCIFTLSDFPDIVESTLAMPPLLTGNQKLDDEMMKYGTQISSLLFPLIDAEVASHGSSFIGTRRSTFSQYINYRYIRFKAIYNNRII